MERIHHMVQNGKQILHFDFSDCGKAGIETVIASGRKVIAGFPQNALLTLTDLTGVTIDADVFKTLRDWANDNGPVVRAGAIVGVDKSRLDLLDAVNAFTRRRIMAFDDREKALEWLSAQ